MSFSNSHSKSNALLLLLLLGFIWGSGYSIARFATTHGVHPLGYSFWQAIGPAIIISLLCKVKGHPLQRSVSHLRYYLIAGLTGIVIPNTNMYFAAPHLPAGMLAVIVNTVPIIAYPLALMAKIETFHLSRLMGVLAAMMGLMLILLPEAALPSSDMVPWALTSLMTPLSFAFCAVYISRYRPAECNSFSLSAGTLIAASLFLIPLVVLSQHFYFLHLPLSLPDVLILLEIILSSIGYILFFQLVKIAGPVYYSLVDTIVTLTSLGWGYLLFQEKLNIWTTPAVILILIALILVTKQRGPRYFSSLSIEKQNM